MMNGLKVMALFMGYGAVGMGGDFAAQAMAAGGGDVDVRWDQTDDCRYEARRTVVMDAASARELAIRAGSGGLEVTGVSGAGRVEAEARACASDPDDLEALQLTLDREGDRLVLAAHYPDREWRRDGNHYARLDLVVEMPMGLAVDVDDSSGEMVVRGTGDLRIDDSSGSITVENVAGSLTVDDSSGDLDVQGVEGDVTLEDGSGGIRISAVGGSVQLRDGSGSVEVDDVQRDVVVLSDGSGSISVREVGGDFQVRGDGSGSIRYTAVAGTVDVPQKKRRSRSGG